MAIKTLRFRIKDSSSARKLKRMARTVNFVWNYCNETSYNAIRNQSTFLSKFDMNKLVSGASKELLLHSQSIQAIAEEYVTRRV
jgi:hypothetical protein